MCTINSKYSRFGILLLVLVQATVTTSRSQIQLLQVTSPVAVPSERTSPPEGVSLEEWLTWFDARHRDVDAHASFLSIESQYRAELILPESHRYYRSRLREMATEFNRRYAQLPQRPPEPLQLVRLLIDVVRWGLADDDRECIGYAWFFYRLCEELGYQDGNEFRSYIFSPRPQGGHSFNRITIRNQAFVVDAYNDILIRR
jgi:hypothetical protein